MGTGNEYPSPDPSILRGVAYLGAMRLAWLLTALSLCAATPGTAQPAAPAPPPPQQPQGAPNPFQSLFTPWQGANREAIEAEAAEAPPAPREGEGQGAIPAGSPLVTRSRAEAVALGERVGAVVRAGDCAEGERIAREARDFALVRAVRAHCTGR